MRDTTNYGLEGKKAEYCVEHKKENMVNVKNKKCKENGCQKQPHYGLEDMEQMF